MRKSVKLLQMNARTLNRLIAMYWMGLTDGERYRTAINYWLPANSHNSIAVDSAGIRITRMLKTRRAPSPKKTNGRQRKEKTKKKTHTIRRDTRETFKCGTVGCYGIDRRPA